MPDVNHYTILFAPQATERMAGAIEGQQTEEPA